MNLEKMRQRQRAMGNGAVKLEANHAPPRSSISPQVAYPPGRGVTFACGHTRPVAELAVRECISCTEQKRVEARLQHQASRAKKQARRAGHGRLPDGSSF